MSEFWKFSLKVIIVHFITYLIAGLIFSNIFNYNAIFEMDIIKDYYISYSSHNIILGPLLQPIRGLLFAIAIFPLRDFLKKKKNGWLTLWLLILMLGIFSTPGATPSSIEGLLYTRIPLWFHLIGLPEMMLQTLAFSFILLYWDTKPVTKNDKNTRNLIRRVITAVSSASFAYIGYAIGALSTIALTEAITQTPSGVDIAASGSDIKIQLMFVVAFIINTILVYFLGPKKELRIWHYFVIFYLADSLVPFIYSTLVLGPQLLSLSTFTLGFLPAVIITLSIKYNYKN